MSNELPPPFYNSKEEYLEIGNSAMKSLYEKLWRLIGGRPWTYIFRDMWHDYEYLIQLLWFFVGIAIYYWLGWLGIGLFWLFYTYGYINGHLYWGTRYIPGQKG